MIMKSKEKAAMMLEKACERCESYSKECKCEDRENCPVYGLYKMAIKESKTVVKYNDWNPPTPPLGII